MTFKRLFSFVRPGIGGMQIRLWREWKLNAHAGLGVRSPFGPYANFRIGRVQFCAWCSHRSKPSA